MRAFHSTCYPLPMHRLAQLTNGPRLSAIVAITYAVITLVMTWPLLPGIASDVPGDLGDSLLNMWILGWGAENVPRLLTGQIALSEGARCWR